jgi:hypothetical protein
MEPRLSYKDFIGKHVILYATPTLEIDGLVSSIVEMEDLHDPEYTRSWMKVYVDKSITGVLVGKNIFIDIDMIIAICEVWA